MKINIPLESSQVQVVNESLNESPCGFKVNKRSITTDLSGLEWAIAELTATRYNGTIDPMTASSIIDKLQGVHFQTAGYFV